MNGVVLFEDLESVSEANKMFAGVRPKVYWTVVAKRPERKREIGPLAKNKKEP